MVTRRCEAGAVGRMLATEEAMQALGGRLTGPLAGGRGLGVSGMAAAGARGQGPLSTAAASPHRGRLNRSFSTLSVSFTNSTNLTPLYHTHQRVLSARLCTLACAMSISMLGRPECSLEPAEGRIREGLT